MSNPIEQRETIIKKTLEHKSKVDELENIISWLQAEINQYKEELSEIEEQLLKDISP